MKILRSSLVISALILGASSLSYADCADSPSVVSVYNSSGSTLYVYPINDQGMINLATFTTIGYTAGPTRISTNSSCQLYISSGAPVPESASNARYNPGFAVAPIPNFPSVCTSQLKYGVIDMGPVVVIRSIPDGCGAS